MFATTWPLDTFAALLGARRVRWQELMTFAKRDPDAYSDTQYDEGDVDSVWRYLLRRNGARFNPSVSVRERPIRVTQITERAGAMFTPIGNFPPGMTVDQYTLLARWAPTLL